MSNPEKRGGTMSGSQERTRLRGSAVVLVAALMTLLMAAAPAADARGGRASFFNHGSLHARAGHYAVTGLTLPFAGWCRLTASGHGHRRSLHARTEGPPIRFQWIVPRNARSGNYRLRATCRPVAGRHLRHESV